MDGSGHLEPAEVEAAVRFVTPYFHSTPQNERPPRPSR
jgi:hypothetical protein